MIELILKSEQRDQTVENFRQGKLWVLVTSELVSRGIDFKSVNLVISYDFPQSLENYLHRAGRTGRGGKGGDVITFFTQEDFPHVRRYDSRDGVALSTHSGNSIANAIKVSGNECMDWIYKIPKLRYFFIYLVHC